MPLYDYVCRDCGFQLEVQQSYQDEALTVCPNCQGDLRRAISRVGLVFKGGGYYINDSRPADKKDAEDKKDAKDKKDDRDAKDKSDSGGEAAGGDAVNPDADKAAAKSDKPEKVDKADKAADATTPAKPAPEPAPSAPEKASGGNPS